MQENVAVNMKSNLLIIVLVITALVLGVFIIKPSGLKLPSFENKASKLEPEQNAIPANLTEEEKKLLTVPPPEAERSEIETHLALGAKLAKKADVLEITNCKPKPLVFKVKEKRNFKVLNKDKIDHTLIIDEEHKYAIAAGETKQIKADFGKPPGLYGYVCEGVGLTGFIFVE